MEIYPHNVLYWPEEHRNSGVMTLVINRDEVRYHKDLGENTADETDATEAVEEWERVDKRR